MLGLKSALSHCFGRWISAYILHMHAENMNSSFVFGSCS